jgi:hypothetical protein
VVPKRQVPTRAAIAVYLDLSVAVVQKYVAQEVLPSTGSLDDYRVAYIRHLRGRAAGQVGEDGLDLVSERARLARAQAERVERENAVSAGDVVAVGDVESWLVALLSGVVQRLRAVPSKAAPEAHGAGSITGCEAVIRREQDAVLADLADARWIAPPRAVRRSAPGRGRGPGDAAPAQAADGQRVG